MKIHFSSLIFYLSVMILLISCLDNSKRKSSDTAFNGKTDFVLKEKKINEAIEFKIYKNSNDENDWGYDIYFNGKLYIHQPQIPAISGTKGFVSEKDARKVANLVIFKISNNILRPTITISELDSLDIKR